MPIKRSLHCANCFCQLAGTAATAVCQYILMMQSRNETEKSFTSQGAELLLPPE